MTFFDDSDVFPFQQSDLNLNPLYRGDNLINNENSFPFNLPSYNKQEEENNLCNFSSSSNLLDCFNNIEEKKSDQRGNPSISKIASPKEENPKVKDINYFEINYDKTLFSSKKDKINEIPLLEDKEKDFNDLFAYNHNGLNEFNKIFYIKKKPFFKVDNPKRNNIYSVIKNNSDSIKEDKEKIFLGRKRKSRKDDLDNIRTKIKRGFINSYLLRKLTEIPTMNGSINNLYRFPDHLVRDVNKELNKKLFKVTLLELFEKKELYIFQRKKSPKQKKDDEKNKNIMQNYAHNLEIVHSDNVKDNEEMKKILNKTIQELYEEYINSAQFKIVEINRLKKKNFNDNYIESYIYLAKHLIQFFEIKSNDNEKRF